MAEFIKSGSNWYGFLAVDKGGPNSSLSCRRHDIAHDFGHSVDGDIEQWEDFGGMVWLQRAVAEEIVAARTAAGLQL